jgi:hypothetical protein
VLIRYFNDRLVTSPRQRMAVTGRDILRWLAQDHILKTTRSEFETLLLEIAEQCEEWLTSAQAMNLAGRPDSARVLPWDQTQPRPAYSRDSKPPGISVPRRAAARTPSREYEFEY